jgi:phosphoserine phosphatase
MRIGLFVDIDNTLTRGYVQEYFAKALGVGPRYQDLERLFQEGELNEDQFGSVIVALFSSNGLTLQRAMDIARMVPLRQYAPDVLSLPDRAPVDVHLVSSGPSYYVDYLVSEYPHLKRRVIASVYSFDPATGQLVGCEAKSATDKAEFVARHVSHYWITLGAGDNARFDGPFLDLCTLPLHLLADKSKRAGSPYPMISSLVQMLSLTDRLVAQGRALGSLDE